MLDLLLDSSAPVGRAFDAGCSGRAFGAGFSTALGGIGGSAGLRGAGGGGGLHTPKLLSLTACPADPSRIVDKKSRARMDIRFCSHADVSQN